MNDTKYTITRDGIRYSRLSDRGLSILKEEYEKAIHHMMSQITISSIMCMCGTLLVSSPIAQYEPHENREASRVDNDHSSDRHSWHRGVSRMGTISVLRKRLSICRHEHKRQSVLRERDYCSPPATRRMNETSGFEFDAKRHKYFLDGREMTGCTTILGVIAKPALIQWAANARSNDGLGYIKELAARWADILVIARKANTRKGDDAAQKASAAKITREQRRKRSSRAGSANSGERMLRASYLAAVA